MPTRLYEKWLTAFLDRVDRLFGDAGMADRTLFPRAFWLKTPAPLWTAPAFDRCLFLALVYPIMTIFLIWAISGHVGPAETALGLPQLPDWRRGLSAGATGLACFAFWRGTRADGWKILLWIAFACAGLFGVAFVVPGAFAVILAIVIAVAFVVAFAGARAAVGATFSAAGARAILSALPGFGYFIFQVASGHVGAGDSALVGVGVGAMVLGYIAFKYPRHPVFLLLVLILACLAGAAMLSPRKDWDTTAGPLLLFLGLLTLLNAPFNWASLGLTRALRRRGLELKGWWPFGLAVVDAVCAAGIIALLALVMVVGVQAFDELAAHGGGEKAVVLPLTPLFDGIAKKPAAPEYWWAYALLLSSMIPSLINLAIGGTSLFRGLPGLSSLLLRFVPEGKAAGASFDRAWIALVMTLQVVGGAILGVGAQAILAFFLIWVFMPWLGLNLLDMARAVAEFDVPHQVGHLFASLG